MSAGHVAGPLRLSPLRRRRALDAHCSVMVALLYLRHSLSQQLLADLPDDTAVPCRTTTSASASR